MEKTGGSKGSFSGSNSYNRKKPLSGRPSYTEVPSVELDEKSEEKPWERVPGAFLIVVLGVYLLLAYLTQLVEDDMPRIVKEADVARDNSETFSEEAAWRYLHIIQGTEPRVAGTKYHLQKTQDLKQLVDSVAQQANQAVRTDWQFVSGDYWLDFSKPHVNIYQNTSNVITLLEGESGFHSNGTIGTSLLVNCHYDSVPFALGTSDNAIFCAAMMETLSKLSRRSQKLKHNVIFLFNGAEENTLQGSPGFLKHPWARGVTNVINLDAAGMNGKPNVFQVTDPRVLNLYKSVVTRPNGQSVGEFLFANGIIPSDTDFRIWRDFGNFHGIDIAFVKWGQVYHTRYDHSDLVMPGVIQNAGDMLLKVVTVVADTDELKDQIEPSAAVYYDYLNWFLVTYSYPVAIALDVLCAAYACLSVAYFIWLVGPRKSTVQELLFAVLGRLASLVAGAAVAAIFVLIMVASTAQLRYLSHAWLVVPIYWVPYVLAAVCTAHAYDAWRSRKSGLNRSIRTLQAQSATRLILAAILIILTCIPAMITMRYLFTVTLFIMSTMAIVSMTVIRYFKMQAWQQLLMEVIFSLPSTMFVMSISLRFSATMLPVVGRDGSDNPDYLIAIVSIALAILVTSTVSGIELLFSRKRLWMVAAPVAIACIALMFVPFSPYQDEGPSTQRHYWFHSEIISYNENNQETSRVSGVVVTKHDAYSIDRIRPALRDGGINLDTRMMPEADCENYVHCNLPLFRVRFGKDLVKSLFLSTGPPAPFDCDLRVVARTCAGDACTITLVMNGPAHNMITFWPRPQVDIASWTFDSPVDFTYYQNDRPVYILIHSTATYSDVFAPLEFNVTFTVPTNQQNSPLADVALHCHLIHHPEEFTQEYRNIVNAMPKYFNIASFLSRRKNYIF